MAKVLAILLIGFTGCIATKQKECVHVKAANQWQVLSWPQKTVCVKCGECMHETQIAITTMPQQIKCASCGEILK